MRHRLRDPITGRFIKKASRKTRGKAKRMNAVPEGSTTSVFEKLTELVNRMTMGDNYTEDAKQYLVRTIMYFRANLKDLDNASILYEMELTGPFKRFKLQHMNDRDVQVFSDEISTPEDDMTNLFILHKLVKIIREITKSRSLRRIQAPIIDDAVETLTEEVEIPQKRDMIISYFYDLTK